MAILLLQLIDLESLGFSLEIEVPFVQQRMYTDISRQSFLWVHQKLVGMLEPYEVISNIDIDAWYEDYGKRDHHVSPPQPNRRPAPTLVSSIETSPPHRMLRGPSHEITSQYQSPQVVKTYQTEPFQTTSSIVIRSSNATGMSPNQITGKF